MLSRPLRGLARSSRQCNNDRPVYLSTLANLPKQTDPGIPEEQYAAKIVHGRASFLAHQHPRTHNIPVAVLHFRSFTPSLLDLFTHFASHAAASLAIPVSRTAYLPTQRSLWTVPKSPFVHKKSQENFERKVHKRAIKAWDADGEVVSRWLKYLQRHILAGVGIRVVRWERVPVGIGDRTLREMMSGQMHLGSTGHAEKVKALSKSIIEKESRSSEEAPASVSTPSPGSM